MPKLRKTRYTLYPIPNVKHENTVYLKLNTPIYCIPQNPGRPLVRVFLNVGQLLKQRWLEGIQTVASLSKHYGDKRDR